MTPKRPVAGARGWAFADPARRVFVALNRAGDAYHLIHPIEAGDRRLDPEGLALTLGALVCECEGGRFRGSCYQTVAAERLLSVFQAGGAEAPGPDVTAWFERSPEFEQASEGQRKA